jgi:ABC-2 type transport system permease protein
LVIGVSAGAVRVIAKRSDPVATLYVVAASVLSGAAVPINVFPFWLRVVSWFFPSTYVISGMRKALMPEASGVYGPTPDQAMLLLLGICVIVFPVSLWLFGRSLEVGRRYGVLAGY